MNKSEEERFRGAVRSRAALIGILLLAAALRLWGLVEGPPVWHPDEFHFVFWPLNFFSGDLNPHFFSYPSLLFYLLALVYGTCFLWEKILGVGWSLEQFVAYHYFWDPDVLLVLARLVGVFFAVGTVGWTAFLGRRVYGPRAGLVAGLLLAVCVIHVRQSPLAAVDVPMTFWFVGSMWAALRLLEREGWQDYLFGGALVGLAAATKYPGGLVGAAVVAAHLLAGRRVLDGRLWFAGLVAVCAFALVSPYALLDFDTFREHFIYETGHLQSGREDLGLGWWYHLRVSLRYGLGWVGLILGGVALVQAGRRPRREVWVVLAGFFAYFLIMGSGRLVFVRYALPLMTLQTVLVAGAIERVRDRRWRLILAFLVVLEPLYGSVRVAQLLARKDTRIEARAWIETHVPAGATCCNFGGWAGDVPVRTFENHWWQIKHFERGFGRAALDRLLEFLEDSKPAVPFYRHVVQAGNQEQASGDARLIREEGCSYVILHRHPLVFSAVDAGFSEALWAYGRSVARWVPEGMEQSRPQYDPIDAYYVPLGGFGPLRQPGPEIEIWRIDEFQVESQGIQTAREIFARGYAEWADIMLNEERPEQASVLVQKALSLDAGSVEARILAMLHADLGQHEEAIRYWKKAIEAKPHSARNYKNLGASYGVLGEYEQAIRYLQKAVELAPEDVSVHYNMGLAHSLSGQHEQAIEYLSRAIDLQPDYARAYKYLGISFRALGEHARAIDCWQRAIELGLDDAGVYISIAQVYGRLGQIEEAGRWLEKVAARYPDHPQVAEIRRTLAR